MPSNSPTLPADRNLLFGILALQMDFISRDALIAAMNAWVLDKGKSLGHILMQQGALRPEDGDLLEVLIKRHLQMHGNDAQRSLAALGSVASLSEDLRQIADPEIHASLANVSQGATPRDDPYATRPAVVGQPSVPGLRFRILREHARGGLGAVFLALDEELHREVALKEIQEKYAHHLDSRARFLLEAEVTGSLEHPGVVPVYGLGRYPDGRPFYAMRFIRGDSLYAAIRRFYAADETKRDPGERSLAFRELLRGFVAACNALAYAHSRGILHRDVKPQNIMLGKYGETLVVDWGLAKVIGDREGLSKSEESVLRPFSGSGSAPTQMGHVMGTPAYMSPEQAEGRLDDLGPASDIYGLGATLYQLLTSREPIEGSHFGEILARVKRGEWLPPRKVRKDVPAPLDAICRKALAFRAGDRYSSALDLARDIEHWLADEPVAAYREPWSGRLRRWARRHRAMTAGTAGLFLTAIAALAVGFLAVSAEQKRTEGARLQTRLLLNKMSSRAIDGWLFRLTGKLEPAQEEFLKNALNNYQDFAKESGDSEEVRSGVAEAHRRVGDICSRLGRHGAAQDAYQGAIEDYKKLAEDFPKVSDYRQELARSHNNLGNLLRDTGRLPEAEENFRHGLAIQKKLADEFPAVPAYRQELARGENYLGNLLASTGKLQEAEMTYRHALAHQQQLLAQFPDMPAYREELATTFNNLGILLQETNRPRDADTSYREAIALYRKLVDQFPAAANYLHELAKCHSNLGVLLKDMGPVQEAEASLNEGVALYRRLLAEFPGVPSYRQEFATSYNNLGILFRDTNRPKEAYGPLHDALEIRKQLAGEFAAVPEYRRDLARSHNDMGVLLAVTGRLEGAESAYREAISLQKQLVAKYPNVPDHANDLANTMVNLAELLRDRKDFLHARELLEGARLHHEAALRANPHNPTYRLFFQINRAVLASLLAAGGDHAGARQTAAQLATLGWDPAVDAYAAARALAQCARVLANDTQLAEAKRQELVRSYVEQALAMLRQALSKGFKDSSQMTKDTYIEPLRSNLEFQKLLKELEAKTEQK